MTQSPEWQDVTRRLLEPGSELTRAWGHFPIHLRDVAADLAFDSFDSVVSTELLGPPFVSMFQEQRPIEVSRYTVEVAGAASLAPTRLLNRKKLLAELTSGAAVKLNRMQVWNPPARRIAGELSTHFGYPVEIWGFFSGSGQAMLPWHRDHADNLAVQISGSKRWYMGGAMPTCDANSYHQLTGDIEEYILEPGDVLYVPYGWAHKAESVAKTSYHISIAIETPSVAAVRQSLLTEMARTWPAVGLQPMRGASLEAITALFPPSMHADARRAWNHRDAAEPSDLYRGEN